MKFTKLKLTLVSCLISVQPAFAGGGGFAGSTEFTQLMNNAELIDIYAKNIEQIANQLSMIQNMNINNLGIPIQAWGSIESNLTSLVNSISSVNGIVNASDNAIVGMQNQYGNGNMLENYRQKLGSWQVGLNNQIGVALQGMGQSSGRFATTQQALNQIQVASQTSQGRMQAIQAGNQISGMMVNELQDLHGTLISAEQAKLNYIAIQQTSKEQERKIIDDFYTNPRHISP